MRTYRFHSEKYCFLLFITQHQCKLDNNRDISFRKFRDNIFLYEDALVIAGVNAIKNLHIFMLKSTSPVRRKVLQSHNIYGDPKASTTLSDGNHIYIDPERLPQPLRVTSSVGANAPAGIS